MSDSSIIETGPFANRIRTATMWPPDVFASCKLVLAIVSADVPELAERLGLSPGDCWKDDSGSACIVLGECRCCPGERGIGVSYKPRDSYRTAEIHRWTSAFRAPQKEKEQELETQRLAAAERERVAMAGLAADRARIEAETKQKRESFPEFLASRIKQLEELLVSRV